MTSSMSIHCRILRLLYVIHKAIILALQLPGREGQISYEAKEQESVVYLKSVRVHDLGHGEGCQDKAPLSWEMKLGEPFDLGTMSSWEASLSPGCCCFSSFRVSSLSILCASQKCVTSWSRSFLDDLILFTYSQNQTTMHTVGSLHCISHCDRWLRLSLPGRPVEESQAEKLTSVLSEEPSAVAVLEHTVNPFTLQVLFTLLSVHNPLCF